jgi:hypothetical protein
LWAREKNRAVAGSRFRERLIYTLQIIFFPKKLESSLEVGLSKTKIYDVFSFQLLLKHRWLWP